MKRARVRFLFVIDATGTLIGSISAVDILGEKRMLLLDAGGGARRWHDLHVRDLMEPTERWQVIDYDDVGHLSVGQVVALLVEAGRHHLVVTERGGARSADPFDAPVPDIVRGLFSAARLQQLLGEAFDVDARATTFADIERRLH